MHFEQKKSEEYPYHYHILEKKKNIIIYLKKRDV